MKKYAFFLLIALGALSFSHPTAFKYYASFKGSKQGLLKAESTKGGRESQGWIEISSFSFGASNPTPTSGKGGATGKETQPPITITKKSDAFSPLLLNAHLANEPFETIIIQTLDDQNKEIKRITLTNALISQIKKSGPIEAVTVTFNQKINKP